MKNILSQTHLLKINKKISQYHTLDYLLDKKQTGCSNELAQEMHISRTCLFNLIDELRSAGVNIGYDNLRKTYYYYGNKRLKVNALIEIVDIAE